MSFICCRNRESCECVVEMENKKTKPAPNKPRVTRSVSDSVSKLPAPRGSVKLKLSLSSQQQSTTRTGKKSVTVTRKHSADAPLSRPTSKVVTETEIQEWPTMPNSSFTVLVRVLMAAAKWLKIVKKTSLNDLWPKRCLYQPKLFVLCMFYYFYCGSITATTMCLSVFSRIS